MMNALKRLPALRLDIGLGLDLWPLRSAATAGQRGPAERPRGRRGQALLSRTLARYDSACTERPCRCRRSRSDIPVPGTTAGRDSGDDAGRACLAQLSERPVGSATTHPPSLRPKRPIARPESSSGDSRGPPGRPHRPSAMPQPQRAAPALVL